MGENLLDPQCPKHSPRNVAILQALLDLKSYSILIEINHLNFNILFKSSYSGIFVETIIGMVNYFG